MFYLYVILNVACLISLLLLELYPAHLIFDLGALMYTPITESFSKLLFLLS